MLGLFAIGRRLRSGREGTLLGVALAYAWASYPYTGFALSSNTNDALVSALLVAGLLAFSLPRTRTTIVALAAAAKLAPAILIPLFLLGDGRRRGRRLAELAIAVVIVGGGAVALVRPGVLTNIGNIALFQLRRTSPFSLWGRFPAISWLHTAAYAGTIGLAVLVAALPRRKRPAQLAVLGAAVLVATEIALPYWLYFYVVWFAPYALVALFSEQVGDGEPVEGTLPGGLEARPG